MFKPPPPQRRRDTATTVTVLALAFGYLCAFGGWLITFGWL